MNRLLEKIKRYVYPVLQAQFDYGNPMMLPRARKVVINVGIRSDIKDAKVMEDYAKDLAAITGQRPVQTRARKSISSFKIRQGQVVGLVVTLRGRRMYEFLDKLFNVVLPRVRDFRGLDERGFDPRGNYSIGLRDQLSFPEISPESATHAFGLQITIAVEAKSPSAARAFLRHSGLPLKSS